MAELDVIIPFISSVGFPIIVALYLLVFQERLLRRMVQAMDALTLRIDTNQREIIGLIINYLNVVHPSHAPQIIEKPRLPGVDLS